MSGLDRKVEFHPKLFKFLKIPNDLFILNDSIINQIHMFCSGKSPSGMKSSIFPELWGNLRYHSYRRVQLEKTQPRENNRNKILVRKESDVYLLRLLV